MNTTALLIVGLFSFGLGTIFGLIVFWRIWARFNKKRIEAELIRGRRATKLFFDLLKERAKHSEGDFEIHQGPPGDCIRFSVIRGMNNRLHQLPKPEPIMEIEFCYETEDKLPVRIQLATGGKAYEFDGSSDETIVLLVEWVVKYIKR